MICPKCQNEIPDESVFCPNCGYQLGESDFTNTVSKGKISLNILFFIIGIVCAVIIIVILIAVNSTPAAKYNKAEDAFAAGNYERAIKYYTAAGDYEDAQEKLAEATIADHYAKGIEFFGKEEYDEALAQFKNAAGYENSDEMIKNVTMRGEICIWKQVICYLQQKSLKQRKVMKILMKRFWILGGNM